MTTKNDPLSRLSEALAPLLALPAACDHHNSDDDAGYRSFEAAVVEARAAIPEVRAIVEEMRAAERDLSPPWVVYQVNSRPVSLLPAGRPGEVANVEHLPPDLVTEIVGAANLLHDLMVTARIETVTSVLRGLAKRIDEMKTAKVRP